MDPFFEATPTVALRCTIMYLELALGCMLSPTGKRALKRTMLPEWQPSVSCKHIARASLYDPPSFIFQFLDRYDLVEVSPRAFVSSFRTGDLPRAGMIPREIGKPGSELPLRYSKLIPCADSKWQLAPSVPSTSLHCPPSRATCGLPGEENAYKYRGQIYLVGSASAEFFADIALCPMEMIKVKVGTTAL